MFFELFENSSQGHFYNGCLIAELRNYRGYFTSPDHCDRSYLLLQPPVEVKFGWIFCLHLCDCLSVFQFICLSVFQFVCLSVSQFVCLSVSQFVCLSVSQFVCLSVFQFVCLNISHLRMQSVCFLSVPMLFICFLVCQSVYISAVHT